MFLFASKSGAVLVSDNNAFVSFELDGLGGSFDALIISATIEPKPVIQTHGSVGGEVHLNIFGEDAMIVRIQGMAVGDACEAAGKANSAVSSTVDYFQNYSVIGRVEPLRYRLGSSKRRKGYLVATTIRVDGNMKDVVSFDFVILSEPLVPAAAIGSVPSLPTSPAVAAASPTSGNVSVADASNVAAVRTFASLNPQLVAANGDFTQTRVIPVRVFGAPSKLARETA